MNIESCSLLLITHYSIMILERRKIHFYSAIALAIILPIIFIWGIVARPFYNIPNKSFSSNWRLPRITTVKNLSNIQASKQLVALINLDNFPKVRDSEMLLDVALTSSANNNEAIYLIISPQSTLKFPDPLLYWQANPNMPDETLFSTPQTIPRDTSKEIDNSMILLGSLPGKASNLDRQPSYIFELPSEALNQNGDLIVYSQGYNAIAGIFPLCLQNMKQPFVCQGN